MNNSFLNAVILSTLLGGCATPMEITSEINACRFIMEHYGSNCAGPSAPGRLPIIERTGDNDSLAFVIPVPDGYLRMGDVLIADHFNVIVFADGDLLPETLFDNPRVSPAGTPTEAVLKGHLLLTRDGSDICFVRRQTKDFTATNYCIDATRFDAARKTAPGAEQADTTQAAFLRMLFLGIKIEWASINGSMGVVLRHKMFDEKKVELSVNGRSRTLTFINADIDETRARGTDSLDIAISKYGIYTLEFVFGDTVERYEIDVKSWPITVNSPFETTPRFSCLTWARAGMISDESCPKFGHTPL